MKKYLMVISILLIFSCKGEKGTTPNETETVAVKIEKISIQDEKMIISSSNGETSTIDVKTKEYEYALSSDSSSIIVNARIMSDIQISEIYQMDEKGRLNGEQKINLSTEIWDSIYQKYKIDEGSVLWPRTMAAFTNDKDHSITVQASGQTEMGVEIKDSIRVIIPEK